MADSAQIDGDVPAGFMCEVLAVDFAVFEIQKRWGEVVYVRVLRGTLPSRPSSVLVHTESGGSYRTLLGRPHKAEFAPTAATLVMSSRRGYQVTLLASLPTLADLRPYLRAGLRPPDDLDPQTVPVALEGLSSSFRPGVQRFRPMGGWLVEGWNPIPGVQTQPEGIPWQRIIALKELGRRNVPEAIETLMEALTDEVEMVRNSAAATLMPHAQRLPVEPFLTLARDTSMLNENACLVAARVFGAHSDEVPVEAVVALFRNAPSPTVAAMAVWAMGQYGDRAPVDILARILLSYFEPPSQHEFRMMGDLRVHAAAARALRALGDRAPTDALVAGLHIPMAAPDAAHALLGHSHPVPEEVRLEAEAIASGEKQYLQRFR